MRRFLATIGAIDTGDHLKLGPDRFAQLRLVCRGCESAQQRWECAGSRSPSLSGLQPAVLVMG